MAHLPCSWHTGSAGGPRPAGTLRMRIGLALIGGLLAAGLPGQAALADDALQGHYALGGGTRVDPPPGEPRDSHLYLELTGAAARDLYRRLASRPVPDACGEPGDRLKSQGHIQCVQSARGSAHRCWLGIDLMAQRLAPGRVC